MEFLLLIILFLFLILPLFRKSKKERESHLQTDTHYQDRKRLIQEFQKQFEESRDENLPPPVIIKDEAKSPVSVSKTAYNFKLGLEKRTYENSIKGRHYDPVVGSGDLISEELQSRLSADKSYAFKKKYRPSRISHIMHTIGPKKRAIILHELLQNRYKR